MTLQDVKDYLRAPDGTAEDTLITSFMTAVAAEIQRRTGKTKVKSGDTTVDISTDELYCLAVKIGVADCYENRGSEATGKTVSQYSRTFDRMTDFIAMCGDYS